MDPSPRTRPARPPSDTLRVVLEGLPIPVLALDERLEIVFVNEAAAARGALRGMDPDAVLALLVSEAGASEDVADALARRLGAEPGEPVVRVGGVTITSPEEGFHVLAFSREAGTQPEEGSPDLGPLIESSPDIYAHVDVRGRILSVNAALAALCGWHPHEVRGEGLRSLLSESSRRALRAAIPALISEGHLENFELELRRADGGLAVAIAHIGLLKDGGGRPRGAVAVLRDITRRKVLQERLLEADRLAATGKLAARVAHEINNPLQALVMHMSIVGPEIPPDVEIVDSWERMREAARQIQRIVSDLLDLQEGREPGEGPSNLNEVALEALGLASKALAHRRVKTHVDFDEGLPGVDVRHGRLRQVVLNLVLHAMDSMRHGGLLTLRTRALAGGARARLDVAHTGPEIGEEALALLFDPHPREGASQGEGLGLFVAHSLVRAAGGRISVDSSAEQGTRFRVLLPIAGSKSL